MNEINSSERASRVWREDAPSGAESLNKVIARKELAMSNELNRAISHAVNFHGLDARLNMADWQIADLVEPEVQKWLDGKTDVQIIEAMTPQERSQIWRGSLAATDFRNAAR